MPNLRHPAQNMPQRIQGAALRERCLGFKEVLGSSLGSMGLSGTVIIGIPVIMAKGGLSTPMIFLTAMFIFLLVAAQVNVFARQIATHGSLYDFVKSVFGAKAGTATGWILLLGYVASVPAYLASVPYTLISLTYDAGGPKDPERWALLAMAAAISGLALWLCIRNIAISTRTILVVEVLSLGLLTPVILRYWPEPGVLFVGVPADLGDLRHFMAGLALAMVCFTGFESASVFGDEANKPLTIIPNANSITVLVTGSVTFIASGAVISAIHSLPLQQGDNPFAVMLNASDLLWGPPILFSAAALSWFGCLTSCLNTGGRLMHKLASQGSFWRWASFIHPHFATPSIAMFLITTAGVALTSALIFCGNSPMDILIGAISLAGIAFLVAYALVSAAAIVYNWKNTAAKHRKIARTLLSFIVIVSMLFSVASLIEFQ